MYVLAKEIFRFSFPFNPECNGVLVSRVTADVLGES